VRQGAYVDLRIVCADFRSFVQNYFPFDSGCARRQRLGMTLPIEFDRDLRRHFLKRRVHFLGGVSQAARIDVDANAAAGTNQRN